MKVYTAQGIKDGYPNGLGTIGETLIEKPKIPGDVYDVTYIDGKKDEYPNKPGVDNKPLYVNPETMISSYNDGIAAAVASYAKHISDILDKREYFENRYSNKSSLSKLTKRVLDRQINKYVEDFIMPAMTLLEIMHKTHEESNFTPQYNCGKISKYAKGADGTEQNLLGMSSLSRLAPTISGIGVGLGLLGHWAGNKIQYHNTYAENPYSRTALMGLNLLRSNPYPAINAAYQSERRNNYALQNLGGLTGAQRYYGMIGSAIGNQQNIANVFANSEVQNNALRSQYYNALLQEGNQIAQRRQNAAQHDWADYVAAHGRRTKGIETSIANILNTINSGFANEFKYRMGNKTLGMYLQELDIEKQKALNAYDESKKGK